MSSLVDGRLRLTGHEQVNDVQWSRRFEIEVLMKVRLREMHQLMLCLDHGIG